MTDCSQESLAAHIRAARDSVVRVEGQPAYDVGGAEAERLTAWAHGRPRPPRNLGTDPYLRLVADVTTRGVAWERLRLVSTPHPSEYEEFQLIGYAEAQVAGEAVRIASRPDPWPVPDFWMIDWETVVELEYDHDHRPTRMRLVDSVAGVNRRIRDVEQVRRHSVTLAEYVAPQATRRAAAG